MRFKRVYIEILNSCNLHCAFCIGNQREPKIMSVEQFKMIAEQLRPYTNFIYLHVLGEPLMHPQLAAILRICEEMHFQVQITTNGTLLKKQLSTLNQAKALRQINVSLHSFSQQENINTKDYLQECFEAGEALKDRMYVSYRLWNKQSGKIDEDTQKIVNWINQRYATDIAPQGILGTDKYTLKQNMYLNFEETFTWPSLQHAIVENPANCLGWKQMCAILVNGDVVPCCLDGNGSCVIGNIIEKPFQEIVESDLGKRIIRGWHEHKAEAALCKHCSYRLRFTNKN